ILLPVWLANYRYHDKVYRVIVNGRSGHILGDRPYSWAKITLLVLGILLAIALAVLVFAGVAKGAERRTSLPADPQLGAAGPGRRVGDIGALRAGWRATALVGDAGRFRDPGAGSAGRRCGLNDRTPRQSTLQE